MLYAALVKGKGWKGKGGIGRLIEMDGWMEGWVVGGIDGWMDG